MIATDIMTLDVAAVRPDSTIYQVAELMVNRRISGVPVLADDDKVIGIVTEADLLHRPELERRARDYPGWLLRFLCGPEGLAVRYIKSFGMHASEIMTSPAIVVDGDTPIGEIARILEEKKIKRVPVVHLERLIGIVSRADLMRCIVASHKSWAHVDVDDDIIRDRLLEMLHHEAWAMQSHAQIFVENGIVHLQGSAATERQIKALVVAAENVHGVRSVANHLRLLPPIEVEWM
jgi:CBS domain-containing protein